MKLKPSQIVESFLRDGVCVEKIVSGDSMFPAIPSDSIVSIEPALTPQRIKRGDVVLFKGRDGHIKIHRVVRLFRFNGQKYIQTWGDNCQFPDPYVPIACIIGRVKAIKIDSVWQNIENRRKMFFQLLISKYGFYYMKKMPGKIIKKIAIFVTYNFLYVDIAKFFL